MAGGGGAPGQGGNPGILQSLMKPIATGRGDPLGLVPETPPTQPFLHDEPELPTMATPQSTDRLAFLKSFGITPDQLGLQGLQGLQG